MSKGFNPVKVRRAFTTGRQAAVGYRPTDCPFGNPHLVKAFQAGLERQLAGEVKGEVPAPKKSLGSKGSKPQAPRDRDRHWSRRGYSRNRF